MISKKNIIFVLIVFASFVLRFYNLGRIPPGLHVDEARFGYNAYSILKTGKDFNGYSFPLYIDSFGDYCPAGYFYVTVPSVWLFGLSEFATRFPSALAGVLSVVLVYFLTQKIFGIKTVSIIASFLLAISPWSIVIGRASSEASVSLVLIMLGVLFVFLSERKRHKNIFLFGALLLFLLSYYFYHTPRIFVPLIISSLVILFKDKIFLEQKIRKIVFLSLVFGSSLATILLGAGRGRFSQVSIFSSTGVQVRLDEQIREEPKTTPLILTRAIHNKLINYGRAVVSNYGKYFSVDFLFIEGGLPIRYKIPESGLLYITELPFIIAGLVFIFKKKKLNYWFPVAWLLIGPAAASITYEDVPNVQRAFFVLPSFQIIASYGVYNTYSLFRKTKKLTILFLLLSFVLLGEFFYFCHQYFIHQRYYRPWYRNYGFVDLVSEINKIEHGYDRIVMTKSYDDPYIYILFYNHFDPLLYQKYHSLRSSYRWGFEKYIFDPSDCPSKESQEEGKEEKTLYVDRGDCKTLPYMNVVKTLYREDNTAVFKLVEQKEREEN